MTPAQAKAQKKQLLKEIGNELRAKDRIVLHQLRARIHEAQAKRKLMVANAKHHCKTARSALREKQTAERARLKYDQQAERLTRRGSCDSSTQQANIEGAQEVLRERQSLRHTAQEQRVIDRAGKAPRQRSTSRERAQESDDRVRSNIPQDLIPVFEKVKAKIKGSTRRSRSEAFLEWAHENPEEIVAIQQADADKFLKELIAQEKAQGRIMRKATRYTRMSKGEVEKRLADVPF